MQMQPQYSTTAGTQKDKAHRYRPYLGTYNTSAKSEPHLTKSPDNRTTRTTATHYAHCIHDHRDHHPPTSTASIAIASTTAPRHHSIDQHSTQYQGDHDGAPRPLTQHALPQHPLPPRKHSILHCSIIYDRTHRLNIQCTCADLMTAHWHIVPYVGGRICSRQVRGQVHAGLDIALLAASLHSAHM